MIAAMYNTIVDWKRATAYLLDAVAPAASHAPSRQPVRASCVQVRLAGSAPAGTVTVSGTAGGVSETETLTWTGVAGVIATVKQFTSITTITTTLTGTSTIDAQAVGASGQPQVATYVLKGGHPVQIGKASTGSWPGGVPGHERTSGTECRVMYEETWTPRQGDVLVSTGGETWQVAGIPKSGGGMFPDHWLCALDQREGAT